MSKSLSVKGLDGIIVYTYNFQNACFGSDVYDDLLSGKITLFYHMAIFSALSNQIFADFNVYQHDIKIRYVIKIIQLTFCFAIFSAFLPCCAPNFSFFPASVSVTC